MFKEVVKLIDLDKNKEDIYDSPNSYLKEFDFKKAKTILINKGKTYGVFEHADQFNDTYAVQYDVKKRPLYLACGWVDGLECIESLYEIRHSFKEFESVVKFIYDK